MFDSPFSSQIRCKELAERGDPEPAGAGRRRRRGSPCPGLAADWGLFLESFVGGKVGKRGDLFHAISFLPCASWEFVGSQHQGGFAPLLGAPGELGCWRLPKRALGVSDHSPALFIYLLNPPYAHSPGWIPSCAAFTVMASLCCLLGSPHCPVPWAGSSGHGSG